MFMYQKVEYKNKADIQILIALIVFYWKDKINKQGEAIKDYLRQLRVASDR